MIAAMDSLTTLPLIVGAIGNVGAGALTALAERLLTILLAIFIIGGVSIFALTAFAWLWIKRAVGGPHASPLFDDAVSAGGTRHIVIR